MRITRFVVPIVVLAAVTGACSSTAKDAAKAAATSVPDTGSTVPGPRPPARDAVSVPTISDPPPGQGQPYLGPRTFDLASVGYRESEHLVSGTAQAFSPDGALGTDGRWKVRADGSAPFTTRIVVRRPIDPAAFNGTVLVEWLNVSAGLDASPDWTYLHREITRRGYAWIGVSAQQVGIEGGGAAMGAALALKKVDPARYGSLRHPGDDYSYDMFRQVGAAVWFAGQQVLGPDLTPQRLLAVGESQSAFRLTTYVNALAGGPEVFNGFLVHSRGAAGAPLSSAPRPSVKAPEPTLLRTDLSVPVLTFLAETDLTQLKAAAARQPDTDRLRTWEVTGTAHADAYQLGIGDTDTGGGDQQLFDTMLRPISEAYLGFIKCEQPVNAGPHTYVLRAALSALDSWVRTGRPPAARPQLALNAAGDGFDLDANGLARGGIRTPQVDVPVARLSGQGQTGSRFCSLFGTDLPFSAAELQQKYGSRAAFLAKWRAAVDDALSRGDLLDEDAAALRSAPETSTVLPLP